MGWGMRLFLQVMVDDTILVDDTEFNFNTLFSTEAGKIILNIVSITQNIQLLVGHMHCNYMVQYVAFQKPYVIISNMLQLEFSDF